MQLRLSALAPVAAMLAAIPVPAAAHAGRPDGGTTIQIYASGNGVDRDLATARLQAGLRSFVETLPSDIGRAFGPFRITVLRERVDGWDNARALWRTSGSLAVIWGEVEPGTPWMPATVSIYIGGSDVQARLGRREGRDAFEDVFGYLASAGTGQMRLQLSQLIIGYALLVRAWQRGNTAADVQLVTSVANMLDGMVDRSHGGVIGASQCRSRIRLLVPIIRRKAPEERVTDTRAVAPSMPSLNCRG